MSHLPAFYRHPLGLLTDLYQLTMACGYFRSGKAEQSAVFHLTFRKAPFGGEFAVACGLSAAIDFLEDFRFRDEELAYLTTLNGADGAPLFDGGFLDFLRGMDFRCDIHAVQEGTVVFAHEPLVRVTGPIVQCQLLETALLTLINFPTLIATKAARICAEARGDKVIEFGLRRAQGIDGGLTAARAAYVGGCHGTSNVLAGKLYGIPVMGTHAHSWVMSFDSESESFRAYAQALPNNCVFLVDTYDSIQGIKRAIEAAKGLREAGHEMIGVRLDSGDLAELSIAARRMLDEAGFEGAAIVASNDLDEHLIRDLKAQGCRVNVWGVGTRLTTAFDQPALGGVYKLSAVQQGGDWIHKVKLSEQEAKVTNPGVQQIRRYLLDGKFAGDVIYDEPAGIDSPPRVNRISGEGRFPAAAEHEDLLVPIFRGGRRCYDPPSTESARGRAAEQLSRLRPSVKRLKNPSPYHVALEGRLHEMKQKLIEAARE